MTPWAHRGRAQKARRHFVQAGLWKGLAIRDGNLITRQQNLKGAETAEEVIVEAVGS